MKRTGYFFGLVVFLLAVSIVTAISSTNYNIDGAIGSSGGESVSSIEYIADVIVGIVSGETSSDNYTNELGFFYGAGEVPVSNLAPELSVVSLVSVDGENKTISDLNCSAVVSDPDYSAGLNVSVRWYKNGLYNITISENNSYENNSLVSSILSSGNTTKYDNWSCSMRVYDASKFSNWSDSSNLTILNSLPVVTLTSPLDKEAVSDRTPNFDWTVVDNDNDVITYEINITPYYGANPSALDERYASGLSDSNYTPASDLQLLYDNGYHYRWKVRANDGDGDGDWNEIWSVNISAEVGIVLLVDELYFGNLGVGETNSTEVAGLNPFVIENNGTVLANVSVNASALWDSVIVDSDKYQFKADEVNTETGSFNLAGSIMDWFNMPLSGFVVGIDKLNYSDASDSAELDINMTVPLDEDPGQKSSTIVFLAELAE